MTQIREVSIGLSSFDFGYEVRMIDRLNGMAVESVQCRKINEVECIPTAIHCGKDLLQNMMDELWRNGFRPVQVDTREGLVQAKDAHISDLRTAIAAQQDLVGKMVDKL